MLLLLLIVALIIRIVSAKHVAFGCCIYYYYMYCCDNKKKPVVAFVVYFPLNNSIVIMLILLHLVYPCYWFFNLIFANCYKLIVLWVFKKIIISLIMVDLWRWFINMYQFLSFAVNPLFTKFCKIWFYLLHKSVIWIVELNFRYHFFLQINVVRDMYTWLQYNHVVMSNMPRFGQWSNEIACCDVIYKL